MTSPPEVPEMEPPECPVCLEPYNNHTTIPRVLACGHSTCETCISQLPSRFSSSLSHTIRCPACTQLVKLPHPQGPTALPKNIDLLKYSQSSPKPHKKPNKTHFETPQRSSFPPVIWSDQVYADWKDWVLPKGAVLVDGQGIGKIRIDFNDMGLCSFMKCCCLVEGQNVGLVEIGCFGVAESVLEYSYVGKVMCVLGCMSDAQRSELGVLLRVSLRNHKICRVLGLWLDEETGCLYLISERKNDHGLLNLGDLGHGIRLENEDWVSCLCTIGVELCELLVGLRSLGFVCGCLGVSCFCLDEFGHVYIDLGQALVAGRKISVCLLEGMNGRRKLDSSDAEELVLDIPSTDVLISPEVLLELLRRAGVEIENNDMGCVFDYSSDVWLLASVLFRLSKGKQFAEGMYNYLRAVFEQKNEVVSECKAMYQQWVETIKSSMSDILMSSDTSSLEDILFKCLDFDPGNRPLVTDVWKCMKEMTSNHRINQVASFNGVSIKEKASHCLVLGELYMPNDLRKELSISRLDEEQNDSGADPSLREEVSVEEVVHGVSAGKVHCKDLRGHMDCITALCVGGGFLFSSSFDKTVQVWSLQDFTHLHTFRGHENRVMAVAYVEQEKPLCISADSGGGIFSWEVMVPFGQEPLKQWYEEKDWRYSGIHALAVSDSGYLYTGSGDRLIKAWSLKECTLLCSMEGHKSVVSTLALCNGVLYSGSWDGSVRLWCLHDHSPLAVFGDDTPGMVSSVLSIHADQDAVIAAHENGCIKVWMNDVLKASKQIHGGAIFALAKKEKWVFTGGWDKSVKVQELRNDEFEMDAKEVASISCDSVITALLYVQGILFVGYANRLIKGYHCGS